MFTRILTSSLLFLIAIGGFVVSYDTGSVGVSESYAADCTNPTTPQAIEACAAAGNTAKTTESDDIKKMYNGLVAGLNLALAAINIVVAPAIILASWLMSPDWTSGDAFGLREVMHKIWIVVSNIIYFVYAILLIMIALGTIFGKESFSYQKMLPKLALGILMVPFTWWFVQWTISLSTIVTASVLTIPQEAMEELQKGKGKSWWTDPSIPTAITYSPSEKNGTKNETVSSKCDVAGGCITPEKFYNDGVGMWSPLVIYSYSIFKFHEVKELSKWQDGVSNILQLVHQGIFSVLMLLVFGLLVIALIFMLMVRAIKLWVYAIFSPLFTLHFVAGKEIMGKMGDGDDTFSIKEFIGLCFVPAIIGLTLSFGLIVLSMVMTPPVQSGTAATDTSKISLFGNGNNSIELVQSSGSTDTKKKDTLITLGGMKITYRGGLGGGGGIATQSTLNSVFTKTGGFFGTIIIDIIALIFIWTAFMAAKNVNKAVGKAISPFEDMGKKIGGLAASLPKYAPLPIPGGSLAGANKAIGMGESIMHARSEKKFNESGLGKMLGAEKYVSPETDKKIIEALKSIKTDPTVAISKLNDMGKSGDMNKENFALSESVKEFHTLIKDTDWREKLRSKITMSRDDEEKLNELANKPLTDSGKKDIAKFLNSKFSSGTSGTTPGSAAGSGFATRPQGSDRVNIVFGDKVTQANVKINETNISNAEKNRVAEELKGVKTGMKKDDFIKGLLQHMTKEAATELATTLDKDDFFIK